jgi:hypothetical protein
LALVNEEIGQQKLIDSRSLSGTTASLVAGLKTSSDDGVTATEVVPIEVKNNHISIVDWVIG